MRVLLSKFVCVEAAHRTSTQQRLHGHSYRFEIRAEGEVDEAIGWLVDYGDLKRFFRPVETELDHAYLNDLPGLETEATLPALDAWIVRRLERQWGALPAWFKGVHASILGDLAFRPTRHPASPVEPVPERIAFSFEAAQSLPCLPEGHPCRAMHGHSYRIEAAAPDLDALEPHLAALYATPDHQCLNDIPGLDHATCERICRWVWRWLDVRNAAPTCVVVQETATARCVYYG